MTYNRPSGLFFALSRYHMKGGTKNGDCRSTRTGLCFQSICNCCDACLT